MSATTVPIRYDVRIIAPSTLHIENDMARIVASSELNLRGTFDRPLLFGRADIERGEVRFEGRRYQVTRGSLDFTNPNRIQPFFDVEAETRVRVPGQTYRVTLRMAGTTERMQPEFTSDPPLAPIDILTLLFSDSAPTGDIELASLRQPNQREQDILQARATRALTGALSQEVGRVVAEHVWRRHLPDHAAAGGSVSAVVAAQRQSGGARHHRQAHFRPRVPDLRAQPVFLDARRDHPARIRSERQPRVGALAERRSHLRAGGSEEASSSDAGHGPSLAAGGVAALLVCLVTASPRAGRSRFPRPHRASMSASRSPAALSPTRRSCNWSRPASVEPLSMEHVRETIDHLVGLGRFEDVRVFAEPRGRGKATGVALRWVLRAGCSASPPSRSTAAPC